MESGKSKLGVQFSKEEDVNAWYTEVITKSGLIEYTEVSGCYILRPKAQFIWDTIRSFMDEKLRQRGVENASFPLLIPEHLLMKEKEHVEGFSPEVAWVTHTGSTKLAEMLAIRPTSETIMYPAYSKWIRSHNDLPLKLNQWCSVVRWEFKHPIPFLRSREFHWQEGHSAFATREEAETEVRDILIEVYSKTYEELLAVPGLIGKKSESEKFAGAVETLSFEAFLPIGKAAQGCTTHYLGQNFSKAFNICFSDKTQQRQYAHQTSWGFSTRSIGIAVMMHSDSKGLVLPPRVAKNKLVVIPIFNKQNRLDVLKYAREVASKLNEFNPILDDNEQYSAGWKFNQAELNGIPIRLEIGAKEMEQASVTLVRRDNLEKVILPLKGLEKAVAGQLKEMHKALLSRAMAFLQESIETETEDKHRVAKIVKGRRLAKSLFDGSPEAEEQIKLLTGGKTINIPLDEQPKRGAKCPFTGRPAKHFVYIAKSI